MDTWNRKLHFEHFCKLNDPYFAVTIPFNVSKAYAFSTTHNISFFARYLHDCMRAINAVENFRLRIVDGTIIDYEVIHASATIMRDDHTYGFSFIDYDEDLNTFIKNIEAEKYRVRNTMDLYPPKNGLDCIHCSAMPWLNFTASKEPVSGDNDSIPKIAFSQMNRIDNELIMNVSINVNHALVDGYHVSLFSEKFQDHLNR